MQHSDTDRFGSHEDDRVATAVAILPVLERVNVGHTQRPTVIGLNLWIRCTKLCTIFRHRSWIYNTWKHHVWVYQTWKYQTSIFFTPENVTLKFIWQLSMSNLAELTEDLVSLQSFLIRQTNINCFLSWMTQNGINMGYLVQKDVTCQVTSVVCDLFRIPFSSAYESWYLSTNESPKGRGHWETKKPD